MRIVDARAYTHRLHYAHGQYVMSDDRVVDALDSTLVRLETDDGALGWGEICPLGKTYLPVSPEVVLAGLSTLLPAVIDGDPENLTGIRATMDGVLLGNGYAKSPVDMACWDLLGRSAGKPVAALLGGAYSESFPLYVAVPLAPVAEMVAFVTEHRGNGVRRFQLKVGGDPDADVARITAVSSVLAPGDVLVADANGGWSLGDARRVVRDCGRTGSVLIEQPCGGLDECAALFAAESVPMILDECIVDLPSLLRAHEQRMLLGVNLKISRLGGMSETALVRSVCERLGLYVSVEDMWGGDVVTAAISHLAATTDPRRLLLTSFMNEWVQESVSPTPPRSVRGHGTAPVGTGLGVRVDAARLGDPVLRFER